MADFMDFEAVESSDEEQEMSHSEKKKPKRAKVMDESDEDDEDDEEKIREELKDLIDDNPIEESDGDDSDASDGPKKRKNRDDEDFDDRLEDDDYDLLEENLGIAVERKRFKRLRRVQEQESDEENEQPDEERNAIANELFEGGSGDEDGRRSVISHVSNRRHEAENFDEDDEDVESDYDDFIVDDDGKPIATKKPKKRAIYTDAALQEAQDIFGVDFDYEDFGKYDDEDEDEDDEEDDDYADEDGDEPRPRRKKISKKKPTRKTIFEVYEPSELKRGHFTDIDNEIRTADIPERMQMRHVPITPVPQDSDELDHESSWIYKQAFCRPTISTQDAHLSEDAKERARKGPQTIEKIRNALDFMRNQNFEVPFIMFYRKEYVVPELNINDLWKIYKYDGKWCQLEQRKKNVLSLFEKMRDYQLEEIMKNPDAPLADNVRVIKDDDIERVKNVETNEELNDVHRHFMLHYGHDIPNMQELSRAREKQAKERKKMERRQKRLEAAEENLDEVPNVDSDVEDDNVDDNDDIVKQAVRSGPYAICRKFGLDGMAKKFGLTPEHFAENLRDNYQRHEIDQEPVEPISVAVDYCNERFKTPEEILRASQLMVAHQLAREPLVRKCVRELYMERAKLSVRPTKLGMKIIDEQHPIYGMKYIKEKPVRELVGHEFLKLVVAEKDKLITMEFSDVFEGNTTGNYIDEIKQLYQRDEYSKHVQEWNDLRIGSVEIAMKKIVVPDLKKELREKLIMEAKEYVMRLCCRKMYNWIKVGPYSCEFPEEEDEDWDTSKGLRIMGFSYVPDHSQAAFVCLIKPNGEFGDYLRLPHILKRKNSFKQEDQIMKAADMLALRHFIANQKPHVVAVGGESREAIMIAQDIRDCVKTLMEEEDFPEIKVEICDNDLAKLFSHSNRANEEFREYPELLREAASVARRLQDPLVEFSQMCTHDDEILCLKYNHYQNELSKEELLENLYLEFVNRVNEVGVDLNKSVQMPYWENLVQFVCGLGPRKAQALIKTMKQSGNNRLENRTQLVTACHMGPKVFINCAGFVKIDTNSLGDSTEAYVEILDGSRVHPETYEWARKMAVDALEYDDEDANPAGALEEILESPDRLRDLDLDAFADELERQGFGNKCVTLYDIRSELNSRYKDLRTPYQSPTPEKLFDMLTKETPETFYIGKLVTATVSGISTKKPQGEQLDNANPVRNDVTGLWQCPFCLQKDFPELSSVWNHFDAGGCPGKANGVKLRLDNGVNGFIHVKNVSDKHVDDLGERVYIGQSIHCRIIKIEVERFSVECTSKSSDLADLNHQLRPQFDPFYDLEAQKRDMKINEDEKKIKQRQTYVKRVIVHPAFHNINYTDAEEMMRSLKQGDVIVRPSSKGADHLTATWKVTDDILHHIDILETDKENTFSLGKTLIIGNEKFEDLDEIIARHVNPMAINALELLDYKHYKTGVDGSKEKAGAIIKDMKKKHMNSIPYIISASKIYPGKFLLSYLPRVECKHEYISLSPDGFRFRERLFQRVDELFRWFKKHFRDPIPYKSTPNSATPGLTGVNQETINRVAQALPQHLLNSLSQVANRTPGHHQHPSNTPVPMAIGGHVRPPMYIGTPYTPSGQTPMMTPYQTPYNGQPTPSYDHQLRHTPNQMNHNFLQPPPPTSANIYSRTTTSELPMAQVHPANKGSTDWKKAAEAWAAQLQKPSPRSSNGTQRNNDSRRSSRSSHRDSSSRKSSRVSSSRTPSEKSPRDNLDDRGTPIVGVVPVGDGGTPLWDEGESWD